MTEPTRCGECAEWTLPTFTHVCPLGLTAAQLRAARQASRQDRMAQARAAFEEAIAS